MKLNFKKEDLKENFQKVVIVIGLFILVIVSIKSGGSVSQQNVSTVIVPENKTEIKEIVIAQNPYQLAYNKCTHPKMAEYYQNKCIAWELKKSGGKKLICICCTEKISTNINWRILRMSKYLMILLIITYLIKRILMEI